MKKLIFAFTAALLIFASCGKNDFDGETLEGTTWKGSYTLTVPEGVSNGDLTLTFSATTATLTAEYTYKDNNTGESGRDTEVVEGAYVYVPPMVVFTPVDPNDDVVIAIISGNKMTAEVGMLGITVELDYQ